MFLKRLYIKLSDSYYADKYKKDKIKTQKAMIEQLSAMPENEYENFLVNLYKQRTSKDLDFSNPITYTQKLQWLKLYGDSEEKSVFVDKYAVKGYIDSVLGSGHVIPLISIDGKDCFYSAEEIDFEKLPNQFVIKCNHGSAYNFIIKDKSALRKRDVKHIKNQLNEWLKEQFAFKNGLELVYKNVKPCIIVEQFMDGGIGSELKDYKFFCFDGKPRLMYISNDIGEDPRTDFFDMEFNHLPIVMRDPNADITPKKPELFDEMVKIAEKLAEGSPHLRVDLYCIDSDIYVGEMTFFHNSGFSLIRPEKYERLLGSWIPVDMTKRENNYRFRKENGN